MARAKAKSQRKGNATGKSLDVVKATEGKAVVTVPDIPPYLVEAPGAVEMWAAIYAANGHAYSPTDQFVIERYVHLQSERYRIIAKLDGSLTTRGSQGNTQVLHPLVRRLSDIEGKLNPLEDRLGLSPESRARLGLEGGEGDDPFAEFFGGAVEAEIVE